MWAVSQSAPAGDFFLIARKSTFLSVPCGGTLTHYYYFSVCYSSPAVQSDGIFIMTSDEVIPHNTFDTILVLDNGSQ